MGCGRVWVMRLRETKARYCQDKELSMVIAADWMVNVKLPEYGPDFFKNIAEEFDFDPVERRYSRKLPKQFRTNPILHRIGFPGVSFLRVPRFDILGYSEPVIVSAEELSAITDNFSPRNLIGITQFGKVCRGTIVENWDRMKPRQVMVKIWENCYRTPRCISCEEAVDVCTVYNFEPLDTVHNLIKKDDFSWTQRIKVALELARALQCLHGAEKPYFVRNLIPAHIIVDKNYSPKIFDFCQMSGGVLGKITYGKRVLGFCLGYEDIKPEAVDDQSLIYHDVFSYGNILLGLISKQVTNIYDDFMMDFIAHEWARKEYKPKCSLVHPSLVKDSGFHADDGIAITELGMRCIDLEMDCRPSMKDTVKSLEDLRICEQEDLQVCKQEDLQVCEQKDLQVCKQEDLQVC
ncbi:probable serine/threonine-protein kinase PBL11 [Ziziphus jujuba]|uniref:Probable serine/threonine-protein kinase PBL11 n=1 Tax=Ziziphus jujuba TaxID=326968 RepID=A0ABM3ZXH1_ZIZJJ|nr:probable serine/threonine-protein kinase PBL11 [Ziziphus jujuba]